MQINVRVNGILAQKMPGARFQVTLPPQATVADLRRHLQSTHPALASELERVVAVIDGRHQGETAVLQNGQEVALLMPIAGG